MGRSRGAVRQGLSRVLQRRRVRGPEPIAVFAQVLDGETLWLAVAELPSPDTRLFLRERGSGSVVPLATEYADLAGRPVLRSCVHLGFEQFSRATDLHLDLVAEDPSYPGPRPIHQGGRGARPGPTRVPSSQDGSWQLAVEVDRLGVHVTRRSLPPTARLLAVTGDTEQARLRLALPEQTVPRLLLTEDGEAIDFLDLWEDGSDWHAVLGEDTWIRALAPSTQDRVLPLAVGNPEAPRAVVRIRNVLRAPTLAVVMPTVPRRTSMLPPRLRYVHGGQLALAVPAQRDDPAVSGPGPLR